MARIQRIAQRIAQSVVFYPVTVVYLSGSLILALVVGGWLQFDAGLLMLAAITGLVLLVATYRDIGVVHGLVNSQHDVLVRRIEQLLKALTAAGVQIPHDEQGGGP